MKKLFFIPVLLFLLVSCTPKQWVITDFSSEKIAIDSTTDKYADKEMETFIAPYKVALDKEMNQVIGYSTQEMKAGKPESLLSNWNADIYRQAASEYIGKQVDMGVVNLGGLRAPIPQGDITIRDMFQLMPFENELVILWLDGNEVKELLNIFAKEGGQGVSGVSMVIRNGKAEHCKIGNTDINDTQLYSIATSDYLSSGNDRMLPLKWAKKRVNTGLKLRDVLIEHVIRQTKNGKKIQSELDDRISVK